jgi:hypothetical protein
LISDFELNILKSADEMLLGIVVLGCFFHLSKAIWKKVQVSGFATQFDEQEDFHKFVKNTIATILKLVSNILTILYLPFF